MHNQNIGIVIAKYNENVDWSRNLDKVYIYNKGDNHILGEIFLPNVGREAQTYLHHIVTKYDNLDDITVFLQGNPFDHGVESIKCIKIHYPEDKFHPFNKRCNDYKYYTCERNNFKADIFCSNYNIELPTTPMIEFVQGAQFAVPKSIILSRTLDFYKNLYHTLSIVGSNPPEAHTMERIWKYIFTKV
jgi:hypothetical protein